MKMGKKQIKKREPAKKPLRPWRKRAKKPVRERSE